MVRLRRRRAAEADATEADAAEAEAAQADAAEPEAAGGESAAADPVERITALEKRVRHLEAIVEGLQDLVHRESIRRGKQIEGLESKTEPDEIARALSRDARQRGI